MKDKPSVIFFDIGHTLVRGTKPSARRLLAADLALSEKEAKRAGRLVMTHYSQSPSALAGALKQVLPNRSEAEIRSSLEKLWDRQIADVAEIDGATPLLRSLKNSGFKLGVLSNIWHPFYEGLRRSCSEMLELIDYQVLSYRTGHKKPDLRLFRYALQKADASASSCWMVGDTYELDMAPALKIGMHTVWLLTHPDREKSTIAQLLRGEKKPPDWVTEDLQGISAFLQKREERK